MGDRCSPHARRLGTCARVVIIDHARARATRGNEVLLATELKLDRLMLIVPAAEVMST